MVLYNIIIKSLNSYLSFVPISLCSVLHKYGCLLGVWKCNIKPYGGLIHIKVALLNMLLLNHKLRFLNFE